MKTLKMLLTAGLIGLMSATYAQSTLGNDGTLTKMQKVIDHATNQNQEVVRIEADIIRTEQVAIRQLQQGYTYKIVGVGSNQIEDLDIELYKEINNSWVFIKKDADASSLAMVVVSPSSTGIYKIVIKAYKFEAGYDVGHYGLVIYHE